MVIKGESYMGKPRIVEFKDEESGFVFLNKKHYIEFEDEDTGVVLSYKEYNEVNKLIGKRINYGDGTPKIEEAFVYEFGARLKHRYKIEYFRNKEIKSEEEEIVDGLVSIIMQKKFRDNRSKCFEMKLIGGKGISKAYSESREIIGFGIYDKDMLDLGIWCGEKDKIRIVMHRDGMCRFKLGYIYEILKAMEIEIKDLEEEGYLGEAKDLRLKADSMKVLIKQIRAEERKVYNSENAYTYKEGQRRPIIFTPFSFNNRDSKIPDLITL